MTPLIDSDHKKCKSCGEVKPLSGFHPNKTCSKGVVGTCRDCTNKRVRRWKDVPEVKEKVLKQQRDRFRIRKLKAIEIFGDKCADCGTSYHPSVYEFHHIDPSSKDFSPANATSEKRFLEEVSKCVMLCANCHRVRHYHAEELCEGGYTG